MSALIRMISRLMNGTGGSTSESASAVPRTSRPRTVHGSVDTRSSTTTATWGLVCTLRNFRVAPMACPPMTMSPLSSSRNTPTGLFCGAPPASTVARRPSGWSLRYARSMSVKVTMAMCAA